MLRLMLVSPTLKIYEFATISENVHIRSNLQSNTLEIQDGETVTLCIETKNIRWEQAANLVTTIVELCHDISSEDSEKLCSMGELTDLSRYQRINES